MELKKSHLIGIGAGIVLLLASLFFIGTAYMFLIVGLGVIVIATPFMVSVIEDSKISQEKEEMFLEFSRNLVESVKSGLSISKSIIIVKDKSYGALGKHINKLANQIQLGIPLSAALQIFARDVNNKTVSRAITLIGQAEKAGGDIGGILESVAGAVSMTDSLKKERRAAISTLVVQGYIIFFVFMIIILVMQFKILPMVSGIADLGSLGSIDTASTGISQQEISSSFLYLLLVQGLFTGLTIGKITEGSVKFGMRHSFVLMLSSFLVSAVAGLFF